MVVTKITQRKRKQPEWLVNDVHPVLDLTEDGDDSESLPMSVFESACNENGKDSPPKTVDFPSSDQEILSDNQEEDDLPSSNSAKDSPIVKDACMEVESPIETEPENHMEGNVSEVVLSIERIEPSTKINPLDIKISAHFIVVRGGDNKESIIYEWPLEKIARIGYCYHSDWEEDSKAYIVVTTSVPLVPLSGPSKAIDKCLLELSKFRESFHDILKLSPIFGGIIEELKLEDVTKTLRSIKSHNSQASTSFFTTYSEKSDESIDAFKVLVYPQGDPDAVTITRKDIKILNPFEFLNDTIIDFYIKYLQQTTIAPKKLENLHFFNSFFFSKLAEDGIGGPAAFERVKKWTRKVNIFEKDFIFIPVNQSLHWSLIIICHPGQMWDVTTDGSPVGDACILHLDSMEGFHRGLDRYIKSYLFQEWKERNPNEITNPYEVSYAEEFFSEMPYRYSKVPQQDNNCDCGLFLLHYVELFLKTAPPVYRTKRQKGFPTQFLQRNWFKPSEASAKRLVIKKLILELSLGRSLGSPRDNLELNENAPNGVFLADEDLTVALPMSLRADEQCTAQSISVPSPGRSDPSHQMKEAQIDDCAYPRLDDAQPCDDLSGAVSSSRQEESAELQHMDVSPDNLEGNNRCGGPEQSGNDGPRVSWKSGAAQLNSHVWVVDDDLESGPEAVIPPNDDTWIHENSSAPSLSLQVKPLQVPVLLDKLVLQYNRPSTTVDLRVQDDSQSSDDPSCSLLNEDAVKLQKNGALLEFDSVLSPDEGNNSGPANNDDEIHGSSVFDAKQRCATSNLQAEVASPVKGTLEVGSASGLSSEFVHALPDDYFKEEGLSLASGLSVTCRSTTSPSGRIFELNGQGALTFGLKKHSKDLDSPRKDHQSNGFTMNNGQVQVIEELTSDDSADDFEAWESVQRSIKDAKRPSLEGGRRVTRSTRMSQRLGLSAENQSRNNALEALLRNKESKRR
uniref:Ubiquitin-like protease family profile domain-containing protein n=1 Tax=Physcomitrium patens TaxID=3218 RepID=A0A7I4CP36_PHYPA|nr:ubiquitin-like-specific protease 2 isoform X2 [Physcomitrium patens]|eukprot:XP_024365449.1 ubiquitin-like-specific protease 2 isoform X2 [Physcomitrella patens]